MSNEITDNKPSREEAHKKFNELNDFAAGDVLKAEHLNTLKHNISHNIDDIEMLNDNKQNNLITSGKNQNIKTINGESLLVEEDGVKNINLVNSITLGDNTISAGSDGNANITDNIADVTSNVIDNRLKDKYGIDKNEITLQIDQTAIDYVNSKLTIKPHLINAKTIKTPYHSDDDDSWEYVLSSCSKNDDYQNDNTKKDTIDIDAFYEDIYLDPFETESSGESFKPNTKVLKSFNDINLTGTIFNYPKYVKHNDNWVGKYINAVRLPDGGSTSIINNVLFPSEHDYSCDYNLYSFTVGPNSNLLYFNLNDIELNIEMRGFLNDPNKPGNEVIQNYKVSIEDWNISSANSLKFGIRRQYYNNGKHIRTEIITDDVSYTNIYSISHDGSLLYKVKFDKDSYIKIDTSYILSNFVQSNNWEYIYEIYLNISDIDVNVDSIIGYDPLTSHIDLNIDVYGTITEKYKNFSYTTKDATIIKNGKSMYSVSKNGIEIKAGISDEFAKAWLDSPGAKGGFDFDYIKRSFFGLLITPDGIYASRGGNAKDNVEPDYGYTSLI